MDVCEFRFSACFWFWHIKEWKGIFKVFSVGCEGFACIASVITEVMVFLSNGIEKGELRNQSFNPAFTTIMGPLGGMVFLLSEGLLDKPLMDYVDEVSENLWRALKA